MKLAIFKIDYQTPTTMETGFQERYFQRPLLTLKMHNLTLPAVVYSSILEAIRLLKPFSQKFGHFKAKP